MSRYSESIKKSEIVEAVRRDYLTRKRQMRQRHMQWLETLYAIHGEQHRVIRNGQLLDLRQLRPDEVDKITVTHNYLFQSFRAMLSSALQGEPTPVIALGRAGRDGKQLARSCERLLQWIYHEKDLRPAMKSALSWAFTCGIGYMGCMWDLMAADPTWVPDTDGLGNLKYKTEKQLMVDDAGERVLSEYGTPLTEDVMTPVGRYKLLGDVKFFSPSPFDIFPQRVRNWSEVRNVIMRGHMPRDDVAEMFGEKADKLVPDVRSEDFIRFDDYDDPTSATREDDMVLLLTYCQKPTLKDPYGKYCVVANDQLLHEGELPGGDLPIHPIYDNEHPAHLFGESAIRQALEIQRDLNAAEADMKMDRRLHAHPRLICEQGSLVKGATRVPNVPGAILEVRGNAKFTPQFLNSPALPSWVERSPDRLQAAIENVTGAHGISKGEQGGIMSGRQASVVLAADRQKWGPTMRSMSGAIEYTSELALALWREYGPPEKTIEVYGPIGTPMDVLVFYRDYIQDSPKVRIEVSSMMPYNEEIRRQQVNEAWQIGAIPDINMYWKLQRHGEMGRMMGNDEFSRARARQENDLLDKALNVQVEQHEDHNAHTDEHMDRMRDPSWYGLADAAKQAYRMHVAQHQVFLQNAQNPVLAGQSQMPGLPQEGGQMQNLAPTMTGAEGQRAMPGLSLAQESGIVGGGGAA